VSGSISIMFKQGLFIMTNIYPEDFEVMAKVSKNGK
jgi:hypothetical protein